MRLVCEKKKRQRFSYYNENNRREKSERWCNTHSVHSLSEEEKKIEKVEANYKKVNYYLFLLLAQNADQAA